MIHNPMHAFADLTVLSLGAGIQSSALYTLAATGHLPRPDAAIFADTQAEPPHVYRTVWELAERWGHLIPIMVVTGGDLVEHLTGRRRRRMGLPMHIRYPGGNQSILKRSCTQIYKIRPIRQGLRKLLGLRPNETGKRFIVSQWIGISTDEVKRAKPSRESWIHLRWPLLELGLTRDDCRKVLQEHNVIAERSSCVFCPYRSNQSWRELRAEYPGIFVSVARLEEDVQVRHGPHVGGKVFFHREAVPLLEADLRDDNFSGFTNGCEGGLCGL